MILRLLSYQRQDNFHNAPLVAVKISPTQENAGQLIHIEYRAYYKGVKQATKTKEGNLMIELLVKQRLQIWSSERCAIISIYMIVI